MGTKSLIYLCAGVGSVAGGWIGSLFDGGNFFGVWGLVLGSVGALVGVWAGYKLGSGDF